MKKVLTLVSLVLFQTATFAETVYRERLNELRYYHPTDGINLTLIPCYNSRKIFEEVLNLQIEQDYFEFVANCEPESVSETLMIAEVRTTLSKGRYRTPSYCFTGDTRHYRRALSILSTKKIDIKLVTNQNENSCETQKKGSLDVYFEIRIN